MVELIIYENVPPITTQPAVLHYRASTISDRLHWTIWAYKDESKDLTVQMNGEGGYSTADFFVEAGDMEDTVTFGRFDDVVLCMEALGWLEYYGAFVDLEPRNPERSLFEVRYLLALWDVFSFPVLVKLLKQGMSEQEVIRMRANGIDPELMASLVGGSDD